VERDFAKFIRAKDGIWIGFNQEVDGSRLQTFRTCNMQRESPLVLGGGYAMREFLREALDYLERGLMLAGQMKYVLFWEPILGSVIEQDV